MSFTHRIKVFHEDIDQLGHVNNVVYLRYVQEIAEAHWKSFADENLQSAWLWVVLRHEIDYKLPAFKDEVLIGETWVDEPNGVKMPRHVVIKNQNGKVVVRAVTIWCALDATTLKPKRISKELYNQFKSRLNT